MVLNSTSLRAPEDDERASLVGIIGAESVAIGRVGSQESERQIVDEAARYPGKRTRCSTDGCESYRRREDAKASSGGERVKQLSDESQRS